MTQLSIIIPCYNEEANLAILIDKCCAVIETDPSIEILLVNNGSTDGSQHVIEKAILKNNNNQLRCVHIAVNQGYGFGILEGLKSASGDILCWTHADLQTDIFDCSKAYRLYKENPQRFLLIKGRRRGRSFFDTLFTSFMSYYVWLKLGKYIPDINAQPKLFGREFFNEACLHAPGDFSLDLHFLLCAKTKGRITEFPVFFHQRVAGEAKGGSGNLSLKIKLMKRSLNYINKLKSAY